VRPDRTRPEPRDVSPLLHDGIAVWPGDVAFRRQLTTEIGAAISPSGPAWELTVSSIQTTLHVGAHADAPNHFRAGAAGIESVPLSPYRGLCQVIECDKPRGSLIGQEDVARVALRAPRLLFKTGSFPNPDAFNTDFVAFAPGLIEWLIERGAVLVGIDTPSVDPFESKALPAHHATRSGPAISILEGLDLRAVDPGLYELIALPLKLHGADASPVRATLWPLR
jgi:arylformamidase